MLLRHLRRPAAVPEHAPEFVQRVSAAMMLGKGDELPVSALPVDGTYPSGTTRYEKCNISDQVAVCDEELCIQCGNCSFVCPHSVIRRRLVELRHQVGLELVDEIKHSPQLRESELREQRERLTELERRLDGLDRAGADGLVLFRRFLQPDIDPEELAVLPRVTLSKPDDGRLARTWIALRGVETPGDVAKYLLAGADVVMTTSALLRHGPAHAAELLDGLTTWMARKGFVAVDDLRGMLAVPGPVDEAAYERSGFVAALRAADAGAYVQ